MPIIKTTLSPTQVEVSYHRVHKVEIGGDFSEVTIFIHSHGSEAAARNMHPVAWVWDLRLPAAAFPLFPGKSGVESVLVGNPTSPFFKGHILGEETPLECAKRERWVAVKRARDHAEIGGFEYDGKRFESDPLSQARIQSAAQMAMLALIANQSYSVRWTLADNTEVDLDAKAMVGVCRAMVDHIGWCHETGAKVREAIQAAKTFEDIDDFHCDCYFQRGAV